MKHFVIFVPGLGDKKLYAGGYRAMIALWRTSGVKPYYFLVRWTDASETYQQKLQRLLHTIDTAHAKGYTVSIVAASAGSSLALVALAKRKDTVRRVVSVCGKLHNAHSVGDAIFAMNPAFKASMEAYKRIEPSLNTVDRKKILVVRATRDSYVPASDGEVEGSHTHLMHTAGHVFSIVMALTLFRRVIIRFVKK